MKRYIFLIVSIVFSVVLANGCGYTTSSLLPPELRSIRIENFENKINPAGQISDKKSTYYYRPNLEVDITNKVIDKFIADKSLDLDSRKEAALLLKGSLVDVEHLAISYDGGDNVEQFRVNIFVDLELYDNRTGKLIWREGRFIGQSKYDITGPYTKTESAALVSAIHDLAQRVLERIVEAW